MTKYLDVLSVLLVLGLIAGAAVLLSPQPAAAAACPGGLSCYVFDSWSHHTMSAACVDCTPDGGQTYDCKCPFSNGGQAGRYTYYSTCPDGAFASPGSCY